jgi:hypothetical protein
MTSAAKQTIRETSCVTNGVMTQFFGALHDFLFGKLTAPASEARLDTEVNAKRAAIDENTTVAVAEEQYSDLADDLATVRCRIESKMHDEIFTTYVDERLREVGVSLELWTSMMKWTDDCKKVSECGCQKVSRRPENKVLVTATKAREDYQSLLERHRPPNQTPSILVRARQWVTRRNNYDVVNDETLLLGIQKIELEMAGLQRKWQIEAREAWNHANDELDHVRRPLDSVKGNLAHQTNLAQDPVNEMTDLQKAGNIDRAKEALQRAKDLDPRLTSGADDGLKEVTALEREAANYLDTFCEIITKSAPGGFDWCNKYQDLSGLKLWEKLTASN